MQVTTLSFTNIHDHGMLFSNLLRARHRTFIEQAQWDLPQADGMEFDQYDTPASRWVAVHEAGRVLAGARLTPTTHRCGIYSYMIRDAQKGLLSTIPETLLFEEAPVADHHWELSRGFICAEVPSADRPGVQRQLVSEVIRTARALGATSLLGLVSSTLSRYGRRVGFECEPAGPMLCIDGEPTICVHVSLATKMH